MSQNAENGSILSAKLSAELRSRSVILGYARAQRSSISFWAPLALALRHNERSLKLCQKFTSMTQMITKDIVGLMDFQIFDPFLCFSVWLFIKSKCWYDPISVGFHINNFSIHLLITKKSHIWIWATICNKQSIIKSMQTWIFFEKQEISHLKFSHLSVDQVSKLALKLPSTFVRNAYYQRLCPIVMTI